MEGGRLVALPTGYRVGRYTLSAVLGEGGFGITYRARDEALRRDVAVKEYLPADVAVRDNDTTIRPRSASDTQLYHWGLQRFVDEARTLAAMSAPNIVAVHDFMETNGTGYMVMELIEGRSLAFILDRDGPMPAGRLLPITRQLLAGLEAVHARGYLHRDIKPGNILIRPNGQPVLVDFGAARISRRSGTHAMTSVYTPGYAPAEQYAADGEQGPWTDIYALAATLYEAMTGWPPPDATTRLLNDRMVPASQSGAGKYPDSFLAGIDAGLGLRKDDRPPSVPVWRALLFDEPMPAEPGLSATRTDFPTVIAGQRSSKSGAVATPRPSQPGATASMWPPAEASPSRRQPSVRQPSLREQSPSRVAPHDDPPVRRARWPLIAGALALLTLGGGGGLLVAGGLGLFDSSEQRREEAQRRAAEEERRKADLVEAARRQAEAEAAARAKAAADEAERRRVEEAAARQRADEEAARAKAAADEEAARARAIEEDARRRVAAEEEARRRAADDARRRADEEARRRADEEAARARAAEEARRRADEETARARAAEEARRRAAEEEARRKAAADDPQRRAQEEARRKAEEEARARAAADDARRRAAAEEERRRREEAARKPPPSLHAGDGRWTATASVQTHARGRVCMDSFTITGTASNGVLQASTTYGGPMMIRIGDDGLKAADIAYNGRPVRTYWGNMRSTLVEFVDGCIYRITWTKQ